MVRRLTRCFQAPETDSELNGTRLPLEPVKVTWVEAADSDSVSSGDT